MSLFPDLSKQTIFEALQDSVHRTARDHGWWEGADDSIIPEKLMLVVSELAEALEEYRDGKLSRGTYYTATGKPEGFGIELADATIRIMDLCGFLNIDLAGAIVEKHEYNLTRPYRHGRKLA